MANRRMFSNRIANSAKFLQMPSESQLLYFHMVQRADDDGVVEAYPLLKLLGLAPDNYKILIAKGYIKPLNEDQVIVIMDWVEHNYIRADRKVDSIYKPLLNKVVPELKLIEPKPRVDVEDNSRRIGGQSTDGIGKVRSGQVKSEEGSETKVSALLVTVPLDAMGDPVREPKKAEPKSELGKSMAQAIAKAQGIRRLDGYGGADEAANKWLEHIGDMGLPTDDASVLKQFGFFLEKVLKDKWIAENLTSMNFFNRNFNRLTKIANK